MRNDGVQIFRTEGLANIDNYVCIKTGAGLIASKNANKLINYKVKSLVEWTI